MANLGWSELPTGSVEVCESHGSEVTVGNTFGAGVSNLPNHDQMLLEDWNELLEIIGILQALTEFQVERWDRWKLKTKLKIPQ